MQELFHISGEPDIKIFHPRPSPQNYSSINGNVVFAVSESKLHNYLLPRDCPRVSYSLNSKTSGEDKIKFFGNSKAEFIITAEESWREEIENCTIYKYELPRKTFRLLDKNAGYYISYEPVVPLSIVEIKNPKEELAKRNVELRFSQNLTKLAEEVVQSTLGYSIIRLQNAKS